MGDNVQVAVRVRPFNEREKSMNSVCCIRMVKETQQTIITDPETSMDKSFTFDFSYDSFSPPGDPKHASQDTVWDDLGIKVLEHAWTGFNVSLFAYGQTGAGKSFSMVGYGTDKGIIPRASEVIFQRIHGAAADGTIFKVEASMMEIYNEKVKDLFNPSSDNLKVRDHPSQGPYADGLTRSAVSTYDEITALMEAGIMARTTASTNMNATSSRAHTIFQIILTQSQLDPSSNKMMDKVSRINLIDLAGSERAASTGATGARLKEGAAINQSLSALGNCISALADNANGKKKTLVPYRNSKLTHLLKDSLGGNAKTIMIAALSPASVNFQETLGTLRYADRAKQIKNQAIVNEDPNQMLIRQLKEELEQLRRAMIESGGMDPGARPSSRMTTRDDPALANRPETRMLSREEAEERRQKEAEMAAIREQLEENQRLLRESEKSWTDRLKETEELAKKREEQLKAIGLSTNLHDIRAKAKTEPHLLNLNEDQQMSEKLFYFFQIGQNRVGRSDADQPQTIILGGLGILKEHCMVERHEVDTDLKITAMPGASVVVNGDFVPSGETRVLQHNDRLILGNVNVLRVVIPAQRTEENTGADATYDWQFAMKEMNCKQMDFKDDVSQTDKEVAEMESRIKDMEARMKEAQESANVKMDKQREEWEAHVKLMQEEMKRKEVELKSQLQRTEEGGDVDKKKLAEQLAEQETKLAEEMAKAEVVYERKQSELMQKQRDLEQSLQKQMRETKRLAEKKEREQLERSLLAQELLRTIPLVKEANSICEELHKPVTFSVKLLPTKPKLAQLGLHTDMTDAIGTELKVFVTFQDAGTYRSVLWDVEKFDNQIFEMRDLYQLFLENGRNHETIAVPEGNIDPFYEPPTPQLIGRAYVFLSTLEYGLKIVDNVPILDSRGAVCGTMACELTPTVLSHQWHDDQRSLIEETSGKPIQVPTLGNYVDTSLRVHIVVPGLSGIPGKLCRDVFVAFKWFQDESNHVSQVAATASVDPIMDFVVCVECPITNDLLEYFRSTPVEFSVFGNVPSSSLKTQPHEVLSLDDKPTKPKKEGGDSIDSLRQALAIAESKLQMQEKVLVENSVEVETQHAELDAVRAALAKAQAERDQMTELVAKLQKTNRNLKEKLEDSYIHTDTPGAAVPRATTGIQTDDTSTLPAPSSTPKSSKKHRTKKRPGTHRSHAEKLDDEDRHDSDVLEGTGRKDEPKQPVLAPSDAVEAPPPTMSNTPVGANVVRTPPKPIPNLNPGQTVPDTLSFTAAQHVAGDNLSANSNSTVSMKHDKAKGYLSAQTSSPAKVYVADSDHHPIPGSSLPPIKPGAKPPPQRSGKDKCIVS
ncbi:hypothetical protein H310_09144 [Aphanomyces invadans]|uniref:Kinesin motor domain-containing protein n=1 Tax=Aphanomyces invadans TaxID=157072 RepID=A0A024TWQ3_9STRA|nr:hypothetical protein H310_09144 [Aphanomyces invadans]ETV97792.1 hypothetical protein H310_09144 [Aphanomyces invadans]|eukprot:XP_008873353.1 hypothetical protein H310_09144 [Aphanomyces invadans]